MIHVKTWGRQLATVAAIVGLGCLASGFAYQAVTAATSLKSFLFAN